MHANNIPVKLHLRTQAIYTNLVDLDPLADGINIEEVEAVVNEGVRILGMFLTKYLACNHYCLTSKRQECET